jgi:hypothetical protein
MTKRHFSLREANQLVPRLRPILERLMTGRRSIGEKQHRLERLRDHVRGNGATVEGRTVAKLREEIETIAEELRRGLAEIEAFGCLVKDLDIGLIDFPALRLGQEVLLCWRMDEDGIEFWHGIHEGFAGRKPLGDDFD